MISQNPSLATQISDLSTESTEILKDNLALSFWIQKDLSTEIQKDNLAMSFWIQKDLSSQNARGCKYLPYVELNSQS